MSFEGLFHPRGVAIIGASSDLSRIGGHPIKAMQNAGYTGGIFLVNPKYQEMHGLTCYPDAQSIRQPCDLAIIAVPAPAVANAVRDCGAAKIAYAVVLTAGFRETGAEGRELEAELKRAVKESGVRIVGPNCQGMLSLQARVWAAFGSVADETDFRPGNVSCAFQSGGFGYAIVNLAEAQGLGFRYCVSSGNETDIDTPELLSAFLDDAGTSVIFAYLEGTPDARRLLDVGRKSLLTGKPVMVWKAATTDAGIKAAASHTANMTGSYDLYRAALRQAGLIEVDDVEPIVDIAKLFAQGRMPKGNSVGVLSISGGSGIVYADAAVRGGLTLPPFSEATLAALRKIVPSFGSPENPADVTASFFNDVNLFASALDIVLADPRLDQLSILLASISGPSARRAAEAIAAVANRTDKPLHVAWSGRHAKSAETIAAFSDAGIPFITTPVRLARAAAVLARFAADQRRLLPRRPPEVTTPKGVELPPGPASLSETESKALLRAFGIASAKDVFVPSGADAAVAARGLAPPYAVKIVSRDIPHKTEAGGVKLGVAKAGLADAVRGVTDNALAAKPAAKIDGVLVSEMAQGIEVLIGVINDESFGPTIALALGGVLTEVLKDVTYRIAPFDLDTAREMIADLRGARLFDGYRGKPPADKEALAQALVAVSSMATALGPRLKELDINPVFVGAEGAGVVAADALLILKA
ncbi:MAG TPA: acetate--CoA ligase family protein [Hyphomicrobiaceae bacterium]|nr:acetate--CoA ligase family protein [Hyphomicrobiaceae bacterium]